MPSPRVSGLRWGQEHRRNLPHGELRGPADPSTLPHLAGILHEDLRLLLETSMPAKKKKALLGVADAKIGAAILEELGYQCQTGGVVAEILRGESSCGGDVRGTPWPRRGGHLLPSTTW